MYVACIIHYSKILQEDYNRHRVFAGVGSVLHLHNSLLGPLVKIICEVVIVGGAFRNRPVTLVVNGVGELFVDCFGDR